MLPTDLVERLRAVDREEIGSPEIDTARHLDMLEADVRRHGLRVPLVLAFNRAQAFLDGNHRIAVALRVGLPEVPVALWAAPEDARTEYGQPMTSDDLAALREAARRT